MSELVIETPRWALPLLEPARYKGVHGGRGSGKSHERAEALIERCIMGPTHAVCVREIQKSLAQSVKKLLETKIEAMGVGHLFEVQQSCIKAPYGGLIIFQGMQNHTADSIKSLEGYDIAWVEEAQSLSQRSLDLLRPTIRRPGSELWFTWNPNLATDPVDVLLRGENPPPDAVIVQANYRDNPWLPDVLRDELEYDRSRDPDKFAHIWLGEYQRNSEARVFRNWRVEEFAAPAGTTFRIGADFGFSIDPSVLVRCYTSGRNLYIDYEAWQIGCEIDNLPHLFMRVPDAEKWPLTADSSRPETISYLRQNGFPKINAAVKGARSVEEGVEWLKSFDIIVHPRCQHVIDELTLYSFEVDPLTDQVMPKLADKNNHCIAEGELIWTRRGHVPIEGVSVGDQVMTRSGWRRVVWSGVTDTDRDIVEVRTSCGVVKCTPDHEIYTARGFVRADALRYGDEIIAERKSWSKLSLGTGTSIGVIPTAVGQLTAAISSALSLVRLSSCIGKFGNSIMATFRPAITSTTSTTTLATTTYQTSIACPLWPTSNTTDMTSGRRIAPQSNGNCSNGFAHSQKHGTPATKVEKRISASARWLMPSMFRLRSRVHTAQSCSFPVRSATSTVIAQTLANQQDDARLVSTTKIGRAWNAVQALVSIAIANRKLVRAHVETVSAHGQSKRVYDLTVDGCHEFFAGGILVHNCVDALRYACEGIRRAAKTVVRRTRPDRVFTGSWAA